MFPTCSHSLIIQQYQHHCCYCFHGVLKDCDIMFLTETQVESTDDISTISDILKQFTIIHNIHTQGGGDLGNLVSSAKCPTGPFFVCSLRGGGGGGSLDWVKRLFPIFSIGIQLT